MTDDASANDLDRYLAGVRSSYDRVADARVGHRARSRGRIARRPARVVVAVQPAAAGAARRARVLRAGTGAQWARCLRAAGLEPVAELHLPAVGTARPQVVIDARRPPSSEEDVADIVAAQAARDEMRVTGERPIAWERVKIDLGLT